MNEKEIMNKLNTDQVNILIDGQRKIKIETFLDRFGDVELQYDELANHDNSTNRFQAIFDEWKEKGLI